MTDPDNRNLDIDDLAARLREMSVVSAIDQYSENRNMEDFLSQLSVVDDLPVIDQEENASSLNDTKTCTKCRKGRLQRKNRNLLEKVTFIQRKYVCDYCADGVYIRRFNGN